MTFTQDRITRKAIEKEIYEQLLQLDGKHILELGCGLAEISQGIASDHPTSHIIATDVNQEEIKTLQTKISRENIAFQLMYAEDIRLPDACLDMVMLFKSLHHVDIDKIHIALMEIHRVLKHEGMVYISEPAYQGPMSLIYRMFHDEYEIQLAAFHAIQQAVQSGHFKLKREVFFNEPRHYQDFEDFRIKEIQKSYIDTIINKHLLEELEYAFHEYSSPPCYTILTARRVDLLMKV